MNASLKIFKDLLFLESLILLGMGIAALALPDVLVETLTASAGLPGEIVGAVVVTRIGGGLLVGLALFDLALALGARQADATAWVAATMRAAAGMLRWSFLIGGPLVFQVLGWVDVALGVLTFQTLLGANTRYEPGTRPAGRWFRILYRGAFMLTVGVLGFWLYEQAFRSRPVPRLSSDEEVFKYGPLGVDGLPGIPRYVFESMPAAFPELLPRGWEGLGMIFEEGRSVPVGFSEGSTAFPSIAPNCALCHAGSYRKSPDASPTVVPGAPSETVDFHRFVQVLMEAGGDVRFTDGTLLRAIEARHPLKPEERAFYNYVLLPTMSLSVRLTAGGFDWMNNQPPAGPGRLDAAGLLKFNLFRLPYDGKVSTSEIRNVWHQRAGEGGFHRWNGGGEKLEQENMLGAALLLLFQTSWFNAESYGRMTNYFSDLSPPKYPLPVDAALAEKGGKIFTSECADCHAEDGARVGRVTPLAELGVDPGYLRANTEGYLSTLKSIDDPPFVFTAQQQTDGYLNSTLEGIWLRAPYLHNGSVPTLRDLLEAPINRPRQFVRGGDLLDGERVGFKRDGKSPVPEFKFDTRLRGNGNAGHIFGVGLSASEKLALIEYLKTL